MPLCVGHEVIGKAVKVGSNVKTVKLGDRVGVGAQIWACLKCKICKADQENYCPHLIGMIFHMDHMAVAWTYEIRHLWRSVS